MTKLFWIAVIAVIVYLLYKAYDSNTGPLANLLPDRKTPEGLGANPGSVKTNVGFSDAIPSLVKAQQTLPTAYRPPYQIETNPVVGVLGQ